MVDGTPDPYAVARQLGLDGTVVRLLRERGHLAKLALDQAEIRLRLYRGHYAYQRARAARPAHTPNPSASPGTVSLREEEQ
jgi:hypothetical protein